MATQCSKCGRDVNTLAKRRHRCVKVKLKVDPIGSQLVFDCRGRFRKPFTSLGE
jgi:hypothetical protein